MDTNKLIFYIYFSINIIYPYFTQVIYKQIKIKMITCILRIIFYLDYFFSILPNKGIKNENKIVIFFY